MGDLATLAQARRELEDLYSGIPDESVNLTFQDLAQLQHHHHHPTTTLERKQSALNAISEAAAADHTPKRERKISSSSSSRSALRKLPSLDFNRAFEASNNHQHQQHNNHHHDKDHYHDSIMNMQDSSGNQHGRHHHHVDDDQEELAFHDYASQGGKHPYDHHHHGKAHGHHHHPHAISGHRADDQRLGFSGSSSMGFDDISNHIMSTGPNSFQANAATAGAGRRRPGIPHSNVCTICSVSVYMFRHRCLVCGRVYCRQCVSIGMGEMTEGRKCIECLGKRFSQRYIQKAGKIGCWAGCCMGYPSTARLQELRWAEKGPRRSGDKRNGGGRSGMTSRSRSPMTTRTPTSAHTPSTPPSFVASSPYTPYSPTNYHLPL